jgi:hypothetical protein
MAEAPLNGGITPGRVVDASRAMVPVVVLLGVALFVGTIFYTIGGIVTDFRLTREATASRLAAIEVSIAELRQALASQGCGIPPKK